MGQGERVEKEALDGHIYSQVVESHNAEVRRVGKSDFEIMIASHYIATSVLIRQTVSEPFESLFEDHRSVNRTEILCTHIKRLMRYPIHKRLSPG